MRNGINAYNDQSHWTHRYEGISSSITQPPSVYLLSSIGAIGIPYWIERMDSASPHEGQLSGFSFNSYIYKVWNRGEVLFALGGFMKLGPGLTFSWKRALGVTKAKRSIAKATGIPTSRSGRRAKVGRWMGMK